MKKLIDKLSLPNWLLVVLSVVLILRIPTFFEPYSYGDEMIYLTLGNAIRQGLTLYKDIHDNKPPLLYLAAAAAGNLFWFKTFLAFWSLVTVTFFWKLMRTLFSKRQKTIKIATWTFATLTTLPLLEGNIVNAENFMIGLSLAAFLILLSRRLNPKNLFFSGALFGIATLFKVPAAFDLPVIILYWLITAKNLDCKSVKKIARNTAISVIGFVLPIATTLAWYTTHGALDQYLIAAFGQNIGYLSSFRPGDTQLPFLQQNLPLLIRAAIIGGGIVVLYLARKKLSLPFIFASLWLLLALFAITLSERPYPHYLLQATPAIATLISFLITANNKQQVWSIIPLTLVIFVPVYYHFWYYPTFSYYHRFLNFATGRTSRSQYFTSFDANVNRNYEIAQFLQETTLPKEKVFVWGNASPIYALSRRLPPIKYVADYHISDFSSQGEVIKNLSQNKPAYIVILPQAKAFSKLASFLSKNYLLITTIDNAQIYKLISPEALKTLR